ncbi:MAG TPA: hypothetical protein VNU97_11225 [Rhizomicrobium sp.]|jgi:hypothetical protein|nr:hypothetical protein [Rhizomicrobium sp.]
MTFRVLMALPLAALMSYPAAAATRIDDPAAFIAGIYARFKKNPGYQPPQDIYTPRLAGLFAADRRETGTAPPTYGRLDFNFWNDAEDTADGMPGVVKVTADDAPSAPDRRVVDVTFTNFSPHENRFYFEKSATGWKLDDVTSVSEGWALSLILRYGR